MAKESAGGTTEGSKGPAEKKTLEELFQELVNFRPRPNPSLLVRAVKVLAVKKPDLLKRMVLPWIKESARTEKELVAMLEVGPLREKIADRLLEVENGPLTDTLVALAKNVPERQEKILERLRERGPWLVTQLLGEDTKPLADELVDQMEGV